MVKALISPKILSAQRLQQCSCSSVQQVLSLKETQGVPLVQWADLAQSMAGSPAALLCVRKGGCPHSWDTGKEQPPGGEPKAMLREERL